ncbi:MAG: GFA family protein [Candidatus Puniceispirillales bacterium]|tara:strand:+ start:1318 stop:1719 length:402 start_codon:yes stop_codon:yes gene_type:complete
MIIEGGCYCGSLRYKVNGKVQASIQCHCRECQYITGGHPNVLMIMPLDGFNFIKGQPQTFKRKDIDKAMTRMFCKICGTPIGTKNPNRPNSIILKVGTFDDPSIFKPEIAIFTIDKQHFHHIEDDLKSFERKP